MDQATSSVSKGCFAILGDSVASTIDDGNYVNKDSIKSKERWKLAQDTWNQIETSVNELNVIIQKKMFEDMMQFIQNSSNFNNQRGRRKEIPTAALLTGVNMPDHSTLFNQMKEKLQESVSPFTVIMQSKDCSNMKNFMRVLGDQLLHGSEHYHPCKGQANGKSGDEALQDIVSFMTKKSTAITLSILEEWYFQKNQMSHASHSSPKKRKLHRKEDAKTPPVVIMCQDLEAFPQNILHDFIVMCSFHAETLPLVFVFGIATSWSDVSHRLLPHSAVVHLSVEKFEAPPASTHLAMIIDKILLTADHPFKLSGKCLQLILDVFLCHDFSNKNFFHILKFCVFEHFYEQPASYLCRKSLKRSVDLISKMSKSEIRALRSIDSVKRHILSFDNSTQKTLSGEAAFKAEAIKCVTDLYTFHAVYFAVLRCLHALTSTLPQSPIGKKIREMYCICYKHDITAHEGYKRAFLLLKVSSRDQLIERLRSCIDVLSDTKYPDTHRPDEMHPSSVNKKLVALVEQFSNIGDNENERGDLAKRAIKNIRKAIQEQDSRSSDENDDATEDALETVKYAYQLQERLRTRANQKRKRKMTKFEKLREESLTYMMDFFGHHLRRVKFMPFHEAFYFDSSASIKRHFLAAPRLAIQTALADPYQYLQVPSLQTVSAGVIPPHAPDICIAYKLHNECGGMINLYDWMSAFHVIVSSKQRDCDTESETDDPENEEIDEVTQARFIRAVSELQFLGFVKPTKKKTDHVQRLTWSHF